MPARRDVKYMRIAFTREEIDYIVKICTEENIRFKYPKDCIMSIVSIYDNIRKLLK